MDWSTFRAPADWKQTGGEWSGPCPVTGHGKTKAWANPDAGLLGCRCCGEPGTGRLDGDLSDSTPARRRRGPVAGGEDGGEVRRPARPRLPSAAVAGGPPVAGEDSERCVPPAGLGSPARRARKRAAATADEALAGARPWSWSSAR